jgi:hypothetical protein
MTLAAAALMATAAEAQDLSKTAAKYSFEIRPTIGIVFPLSPDGLDTGWDIGGSLRALPPTWPVGIQLDFMLIDLSTSVFQLTADVLYQFSSSSESFAPYLIGGLGLYDGDFGLNAGVGADFAIKGSPIGFFAEGRFHRIFEAVDDVSLFPVNLGVRVRF